MSKRKVEYEVRLHHSDASLTMVMMIQAASDGEAREKAIRMLKGDVRNANIWRAGRLVDSISTMGAVRPSATPQASKPVIAKASIRQRRVAAVPAAKSLKKKK